MSTDINKLRQLLKEWLELYDQGMTLAGYTKVKETAKRTQEALK